MDSNNSRLIILIFLSVAVAQNAADEVITSVRGSLVPEGQADKDELLFCFVFDKYLTIHMFIVVQFV